jgi:hypothetical protein
MAWFINTHRFAFTADGSLTDGDGHMVVTYRGLISANQAQNDAKRRFKEWQCLQSSVSRLRSAHQIVVV